LLGGLKEQRNLSVDLSMKRFLVTWFNEEEHWKVSIIYASSIVVALEEFRKLEVCLSTQIFSVTQACQ
jgi:hypothetical protein